MPKKIQEIFWALPPDTKRNTRPAKLVGELNRIGIVDSECSFFFHGRAPSMGNEVSLGRIFPCLKKEKESVFVSACFSPIFIRNLYQNRFDWVDLYDDWSLAPDINALNRIIASFSYGHIKRAINSRTLFTCNSLYMAGKVGIPADHIVPNGVDESLAWIKKKGDNRRRLILFGHFFKGRTDFQLIRQICLSGYFEEIILGAAGTSPEMKSLIADIFYSKTVLSEYNWVSENELMNKVGERTVALIPNAVSDYTASQDLMKLYQMLALGLPVIVPRILVPKHIENDLCFLWDFGVSIENLIEWIDSVGFVSWDRLAFAQRNSWRTRAEYIARLIGESC